MSLVNQMLLVAADIDNDLFKMGEGTDKSDGDAIANLTYRVTALYTGRDPILGLSAGAPYFSPSSHSRLGSRSIEQALTHRRVRVFAALVVETHTACALHVVIIAQAQARGIIERLWQT